MNNRRLSCSNLLRTELNNIKIVEEILLTQAKKICKYSVTDGRSWYMERRKNSHGQVVFRLGYYNAVGADAGQPPNFAGVEKILHLSGVL